MKYKNLNILDYVKWRGDLSFDQDEFNEIDALAFARLSYLSLDGIVDMSGDYIELKDAYKFYHSTIKDRPIYWEEDPKLFKLMAHSNRYQNIKLYYYDNIFNEEKVEQFSALTIQFKDGENFISYRGTDSTINGWKEDLMMTFDDVVPAQISSLDYLKTVSRGIRGDIYLGGHSKGGNLAIYSSLFCDWVSALRTKAVYSFDGPGLQEGVFDNVKNKDAINKITNYIPQSSLFGRMLSHKEKLCLVYSSATGAMQHDIYSWSILGKKFVYAPKETSTSTIFNKTFHDYLAKLTKEQRAEVVDIIFDIAKKCEFKTTDELAKQILLNFPTFVGSITSLTDEESKTLREAFEVLKNSMLMGVKDELKNILPQIKDKK